LDGLVSERGAHHDRRKLEGYGCSSDSSLDLGDGRFLFVQEKLRHLIVNVGQSFDKLLPLLFAQLNDVCGYLVCLVNGLALGALVVDGFHPDQVHDTQEAILASNRHLKSGSWYPELLVDLLDCLPRVGTHTVHLVDKGDPRNVVSPHLPVDGDGLTLDTADGAENHDSSVKHS
jgi:hypothetical protein